MQQNAPNVADDLVKTSDDHADHEVPGSPSEALDDVDEHGKRKGADNDTIAGDRGLVLEDAGLERAQLEGAVGILAEGDQTVGELDHGEEGESLTRRISGSKPKKKSSGY